MCHAHRNALAPCPTCAPRTESYPPGPTSCQLMPLSLVPAMLPYHFRLHAPVFPLQPSLRCPVFRARALQLPAAPVPLHCYVQHLHPSNCACTHVSFSSMYHSLCFDPLVHSLGRLMLHRHQSSCTLGEARREGSTQGMEQERRAGSRRHDCGVVRAVSGAVKSMAQECCGLAPDAGHWAHQPAAPAACRQHGWQPAAVCRPRGPMVHRAS